jgi:hypothetical protein
MFVIIQHRSFHHKTVALHEENCPLCQEKGHLQLHIMQRYQWFIGPMTPLPKYGIIECDACKQTVPNAKWGDRLTAIYKNQKNSVKTPARMWRGMWVLPLLFVVAIGVIKIAFRGSDGISANAYEQQMSEKQQRSKNIKVGDVIFIMLSGVTTNEQLKTAFTLVKVENISGNVVSLKTYDQRWGSYMDFNDMSLATLDNNKFGSAITIFSLDGMQRNEILIEVKEDGTPEKALGENFAIIQGFLK